MTAADAAPLTCAAEAAELLPYCTCAAARIDKHHYVTCPAHYIPAVAAALRARQMAGRREAGDLCALENNECDPDDLYSGREHRVAAIAALPEVP